MKDRTSEEVILVHFFFIGVFFMLYLYAAIYQ